MTPTLVLVACVIAGGGLAVSGVFVLAGLGWALLAGSLPLLAVAAVLARGLMHAA